VSSSITVDAIEGTLLMSEPPGPSVAKNIGSAGRAPVDNKRMTASVMERPYPIVQLVLLVLLLPAFVIGSQPPIIESISIPLR
jgi:hypothetical protein